MADAFGGITLPVEPAQPPNPSPADPLLDVTLRYMQAVVNAKVGDAWSRVAPGTVPVQTIHSNDPEELDFNEKDLPALYAWRSGGGNVPPERVSEDTLFMRDSVHLFWVMPPARQAFRSFREQITAGIAKIIHAAIELGRDPAWVEDGDPDATASYRGSVFPRFAGWTAMTMVKWEDRVMTVQMEGPTGSSRHYPAMHVILDVVEEFAEDITKPQFFPLGAGGLDLTLNDPTGTLAVDRRII